MTGEITKVAEAARMITDGIEGLMKTLPSVKRNGREQKELPKKYLIERLTEAMQIAQYLKSPVTFGVDTFDDELLQVEQRDYLTLKMEDDLKDFK